jgi:uncharacterized membrane protein
MILTSTVVIFAGAMVGFSLARLVYLDLPGQFAKGSSPGEWFWYQSGHYRIGITLHLGCILPAGLLLGWQFVPIIRHKAIWLHRINGYIVVTLILVSHAGVLMIARRSFGGDPSLQAGFGLLVLATTWSLALALYNVKRLQIDQHRAWMLRTMFYLGTIITERIIMVIAAQIITMIGSYHTIWSCDELKFVLKDNIQHLEQAYPQCISNSSANVVVRADFGTQVEEVGASLRITFGMAMWLAIALHAVGVEIYLNLTPREAQRLRQVSYERQLEAGFKNPGSAGLVVERLGDADDWSPNLDKA